MKLELGVSTIYMYIDALSNKIVTPALVDTTNLKYFEEYIQNFTKLPQPTQ